MKPNQALEHAVIAHDGEHDRCGQPAVLHPIQVVYNLKTIAPPEFDLEFVTDVRVVGYLHDVLEDTGYPACRLYPHMTDNQITALGCMTRLEDTPYEVYIETVCLSSIACYVKLADLFTNLTRQPGHNDTEARIAERTAKYHAARDRIWEQIEKRWWPV